MTTSLKIAVKEFMELFSENSQSKDKLNKAEFNQNLINLRYLLCKETVHEIDDETILKIIKILINRININAEFSIIFNSLLCLLELDFNPNIFESDIFIRKYFQTLYSMLDQNREIINLTLKVINKTVYIEKYQKYVFSGFIITKLRYLSYNSNNHEILVLISSIIYLCSHYLKTTHDQNYIENIREIIKNLLKSDIMEINTNILLIYSNFLEFITNMNFLNEIMSTCYKFMESNILLILSMKIMVQLVSKGYDYSEHLKDPKFLNTILSLCYNPDPEHRIKLLELLHTLMQNSNELSKNLIRMNFEQYLLQDLKSNDCSLQSLALQIINDFVIRLNAQEEEFFNGELIKNLVDLIKNNDQESHSTIHTIMDSIENRSICMSVDKMDCMKFLKEWKNNSNKVK